ncbi:DUF2125 domain-containing protein [Alisedimentitalea sp. MJ-SS2]|uniref:DUF2125 domain-containing protein n=1 Tax=Aliisedimentitalea sp. MJ-SS2 TaxID=3049795 RepID=UPI0029088F3C|nr:DUF2125 domain-containing protein [Alisedimentitalea sp. MJ-SS2]MDU8926072.1 DUF2125 domain-containing protein [Alisedimentitalea sp. MJ-SS2]
MKRLLVVILVLAAGWSGYWFMAKTGAQSDYESWFTARRAEGWQAEYAALTVNGFPNRVDTTFDKPVLADPGTGWAWEAPWFQILALSYRPNHIITIWPETQKITIPGTSYQVDSAEMQASIVMGTGKKHPLERSNLVASAMAVEGPLGTTTLQAVQLGAHRLEGALQDYRIAINADGLTPPLPGGVVLRTGGQLPRHLDALRADVRVKFDRPWDLSALENSRPQPREIRLKLAEAKWGELELALAGKLSVDERGRPTGNLTLKARNWRDILEILRQLGWLPENWIGTLESGLGIAAQLSGNSQTLDLPLDFRDGQMSLGPIPLGSAPIIKLR